MSSRRPFAALLAFSVLCLAGVARGDTIVLVNGDVVTGEVIKLDRDELVVDADLLDDIRIDLEDIASVTTSRPFVVGFDRETVTGQIVVIDGRTYVRSASSSETDSATTSADEEVDGELREIRFEEVFLFEPLEAHIRYEGDLDLGINGASGNTEQASFNVSGEFAPAIGLNTLRIEGQLNRTVSQGERIASNWRVQGAYEREFTKRWTLVGLNRYERDRFQDLDLRITGAAGPRMTVFRKNPELEIFLGPAGVDESFVEGDDRTFVAALWALSFDHDVSWPDVNIYHKHNIVAGLSDRQTIIQSTTGLKWDLVGDLDLKLEYQIDWNSNPTEGAGEVDQRYLIKLSFDFEGDENDWLH